VGYGNKVYTRYNKLTEAQLQDRAIRQRMLEVHAQHAGFPLAEPTLEIKDTLCVAEGWLDIDGSWVNVVGKVLWQTPTVRGVYAAMNWNTEVAWTETPPPLHDTWNVLPQDISDSPCVFIRSVRR
jgi:hypothetical protein